LLEYTFSSLRAKNPILLVLLTLGYVHPIAPPVLVLRLHPRDPDRAAVTFVALGDMGTGGSAQTQVAHAMYSVCQRDGCDFVLGLGDNIYPHSVQSVRDPQFQDKFEQPYSRFQDIDFWASIMASATPFCFCTTQKHLTVERTRRSRA